jgi:hypothetical protein
MFNGHLEYFLDLWDTLRPFGTFFRFLETCTKKNLAALISARKLVSGKNNREKNLEQVRIIVSQVFFPQKLFSESRQKFDKKISRKLFLKKSFFSDSGLSKFLLE